MVHILILLVLGYNRLLRNSREASSYDDFIDRGRLLTKKVVDQGYTLEKL